ncbi:UDP-glucose--hexose-1-phosphate uridylyltransferase [Evansella cellulosilytica]|uniref:Galactose-1-phosphate uridylyltransferase n=1 Tax=Evansella cellulosilytica (strain ATCC 21833 / DSM 2522 / FERM P-1141 / JCM 9156 / N-4) TaxID=649639 RepID=E6TQE0_EVAC2|nr:UDP-glucose--hexose-1-phosphate uridylyltransferase [Evansella cellulosilytica]ADU29318.1 galactose-1-phosphate uridylyltransferase [Evansella cellulosilytica DSM 2522]
MYASIDQLIEKLLEYGIDKSLISREDKDYCRNNLIDSLGIHEINPVPNMEKAGLEDVNSAPEILNGILDWANENGRLENNSVTERDLLDTRLMAALTGRPSEIVATFNELEKMQGPEKATEWFYQFCKDVHYIRQDRISKNVIWEADTLYGDMQMTINLSKPEKDPKEIAAAKAIQKSNYPLCVLCKENVGYAGRLDHPARQNLRTIPVQLCGEEWRLQFSPYVYYHEHAIVFSEKHEPMKISEATFKRLLDFVERFPHYFVGSNADLPIVGGSILTHDHYQGGNHKFPIEVAAEEETFRLASFGDDVQVAIVKWPMSVLRITSEDKEKVKRVASHILEKWKVYNDESVGIYSHTGNTPHHTVTPIARRKSVQFQMDVVLRNNRTSEEHPMGIFHPHQEVHHIKKENIGLIEVMGLAVLPGRLVHEMNLLESAILSGRMEEVISETEEISKHGEWAKQFVEKYDTINEENCKEILQNEIGKVFATVLEHAGVFKRDEQGQKAFRKFVKSL